MADTKENLEEAFAGESQANQKYGAFAEKAEKDGFPNIARLFRTTAEAERIHAEGHLGGTQTDKFRSLRFVNPAVAGYENFLMPLAKINKEGTWVQQKFR